MSDSEEKKGENLIFAIIPEVYDDENAYENFENELERALEAEYSVIVIEPFKLGDETARWIAVGNFLHRTAIATGLISIIASFAWTEKPYICLPFGVISLLCTGVHTLSWQLDPCAKYQVETDFKKLLEEFPQFGNFPSSVTLEHNKTVSKVFPFTTLQTTPVVLVRRNNAKTKLLHSGFSLVAAIICMWRLYDVLT